MRELDPAVKTELEALGGGADIRYVGQTPEGPLWEAGWWWEPHADVTKGAQRALERHLALERRHQSMRRVSMLQDVIAGWKPAFMITGRDPGTRDVGEMRRRDWEWRHSFEKTLADLEERAFGGTEEEREDRINRVANELADDRVLYGLVVRGRKSVIVPKLIAS